MKKIKLFPHNEEGYEKLISCLKDNQMASVNHATGTGKSFILLKYLYENKDKRILYLSPTYPIIDQLVNEHMKELGINYNEFKQFDTMIYLNLLKLDMESIAKNYDIIVLDEYHRCGSRKVGKKINELLKILKEKYKDVHVIGTSATKVRYLDNERNMNDILFDGVEASSLTLEDAILRGILPAPIYVSFNFNLISDLNLLEKKIERYTFFAENKRKHLSEIKSIKNEVEQLLINNNDFNKYLEKKGKYLVFSSSISNIEYDKKVIQKILGNSKEYTIHSLQKKEENEQILEEFKNESEVRNVLYSVDILNEGVHIKGVDAIFMMRKTSSPIIYFQQLGRLLSYSRKDDNVVVFDMVNNLKRYPVIYKFYEEVIKKAKKLMVSDKKNKHKYEKILKNFQIVDKTSNLAEKIDILKRKFTKEALIEERISFAINILENPENYSYPYVFQAKLDIIKFQRFVDIKMHERIKKLNIETGCYLYDLKTSEFKSLLEGNKNLYEKDANKTKDLFKKVQNFVDSNYKVPGIFSADEEEKNLAISLFSNYSFLSDNYKDYIKVNASDDLSSIEAVLYNTVKYVSTKELISDAVKAIKIGCKISVDLYILLSRKINNPKLNNLMLKNLAAKEKNSLENESKKNYVKKYELSEIVFKRSFEEVNKKVAEELKKVDLDTYVDKLYNDLIYFITTYKKEVEFTSSSALPPDVKILEKELYCKKVLFSKILKGKGYLDKITELELEVKSFQFLEQPNVKELLDFIKNHNGAFPSSKNKSNKREVYLANFYRNNIHKFTSAFYDMVNEIRKNFMDYKSKILNDYISFIKKNERKPMNTYSDEYEVSLNEYLNRFMPEFNSEQLQKYNDAVSSIDKYRSLEKIYEQIERKKIWFIKICKINKRSYN